MNRIGMFLFNSLTLKIMMSTDVSFVINTTIFLFHKKKEEEEEELSILILW